MTTNKPEVVGFATHHDEPMLRPSKGEATIYCDDGEEPVALIRLTDYEALQAKCDTMVEALEQIERWDGFPATGKTWEGSGEPVSYGAAFGSNGERDFMREVARKALAAHRKGAQP